MACEFCLADPHPLIFGTPRVCLFNEDGSFNAENWNCGFQSKALRVGFTEEVEGYDCCSQTMTLTDSPEMLVFFRHKHRGRASTLVILRDEPGEAGVELATRSLAEPYFQMIRDADIPA